MNPVWYIDMTEGRTWVIANTLDQLRDWAVNDAAASGRNFHDYSLARLFPFIEQMGTWTGHNPKEFWWEREWRHVGPLTLPATGVIWLCPEEEIEALNKRVGRAMTPWIDPRWGLEAIIAHLAGFKPEDISPFVTPPPPALPFYEATWSLHSSTCFPIKGDTPGEQRAPPPRVLSCGGGTAPTQTDEP